MPPQAKLVPLPEGVPVPVAVGERVAFREDHPNHPGLYGVVSAVGTDPADDKLKLDLRVFDPAVGPNENDSTTFRATMGDIQ